MVPTLTNRLLKQMLFVFVLCAVSIPRLQADVTVSRTRIGGRTSAIFRNSWSEFQCFVENTDKVPHDVRVRVRAADDGTQSNFFSGSIRIPAETSSYLRFPIITENSQKYLVDLFCDGKKHPTGEMSSILVNFCNNKQRRSFVFSDDGETPSFLFSLKGIKEEHSATVLPADSVPDSSLYYQNCDTLIIDDPDFTRFSSAQFQAILTYVAEGGILLFTNPKGALAAAQTPLADLLPVIPQKTVTSDKLPLSGLIRAQANLPGQADFLVSIPRERSVVSAQWEGLPLFAERQYGLGTVRLLAFEPKKEDFLGKDSAALALAKRLIVRQALFPNRVLFESKLDQLTGFDIPSVSEISGMAVAYLAVFFVILLMGFLLHCPRLAWLTTVVAAVGMIAIVLHKAAKTFENRNSVLAEVTLESAQPVRSGETFGSCFMKEGATVRLQASGDADIHFSTILRDPRISYYSTAFLQQTSMGSKNISKTKDTKKKVQEERPVRIVAPLDITRSETGSVYLPGLSLAPRTSREFMARFSRPATESMVMRPGWEPELILSDKGLDMTPYQVPKELGIPGSASVWLVLPGGVRSVSMNGSGLCRLSGGGGLLVDEAARSMALMLTRGLRKQGPYLAFIRDVNSSFLTTNVRTVPQGKKILMVPARITIASRTVRIPREFLTFSPRDVASRFVVNGNDIMTGMPILTGFAAGVRISLPSEVAPLLKPEKISLVLDCRMADSVSLDAVLSTPSGEKSGRKNSRNEYEFTDFPPSYRTDEAAAFTLFLKTKHLVNPSSLSPEQAMMANSWSLRSLEAEVTGKLDESIPLPARF